MEQPVNFAFNNEDEQHLIQAQAENHQNELQSHFSVAGGPSFNQVQSTHVGQPSCYQRGGQLHQQQPEWQFQHGKDNTNKLENKKKPWGNELSYAQMAIRAISSSPEQRLTLSEIYAFLIQNYEFFAKNRSKEGWKNSIRHNLSLKKYFVRTPIPGSDKLSCWSIDYVELKRRKRKHTRDKPYPGSVSNVTQMSNQQRDEQNLSAPSSHLLQRPTQQSDNFTTYNNYISQNYTQFNQNCNYGRDGSMNYQQPRCTLIQPQQQQMPRQYYQMPQPAMPFQQRAPLQNLPVAGQQNNLMPSTSYDTSMDIKHEIGQYLQTFCAAHESGGGSCDNSCKKTQPQQSSHQQIDRQNCYLPSQTKTIQLTTQQYHSSSGIQQINYDQNNSNKQSEKNPICNYGGGERTFQQPPGMYYAQNSQVTQPQQQQQQLPWQNCQLPQTQMSQGAVSLQQQQYQQMDPTQNPPVEQQQCLPSASNDHTEKGTIGLEEQYCCAARERQGYCYCSTTQTTLPLSAQLTKDHDQTLSFFLNNEENCCATCESHGFCKCDKTQALPVAPASQSTLPGDDQKLRAELEEFNQILMTAYSLT